MKNICIRKKSKVIQFKRIMPADVFKFHDGLWEAVTVCCSPMSAPTMIIRKKMTRTVVTVTLITNDGCPFLKFVEVSPKAIVEWVETLEQSELKFTGGHFGINNESEVSDYAPIEVGDTFKHGWDREYKVKFIGEDGSLMAWDNSRGKSIFVNRNDRDQLKAYGMQLI